MKLDYEKLFQKMLLEESKSSEIDLLYHYTDRIGMHGILTSKELHLSDYQYMNDQSEFKHGLIISQNTILKKIVSELEENRDRPEFLNRLNGWIKEFKSPDFVIYIFITCFCENGDLLSQWKGYSSFGEGYSIGLNKNDLLSFCNQNENHLFSKVIYLDKDKDDITRILLEKMKEYADEDPSTLISIAKLTIEIFILLAFFFKSNHFAEENEWRLVYYRLGDTKYSDSVQLKVASRGIVPFYRFPLDLSIIKRVYYGSINNPSQVKKALRLLLDEDNTEFIQSSIPLQ